MIHCHTVYTVYIAFVLAFFFFFLVALSLLSVSSNLSVSTALFMSKISIKGMAL